MGNAKRHITEDDYIKAVRKADREREIEYHGKQVSMHPTKTHKSMKAYDRSKDRKGLKTDFDDE